MAVVLVAASSGAASPETESNVFDSPVSTIPESQLDQLVRAQLARLNLQPVLCSDAVFVRRVYLDVLGALPTAKEARSFIQDPDTENKRRLLIDRLLQRDEFADYWAMRWGDVLRIKAEFPVNLWPNAAQAYHRWVRASLAENKPYDQFARELLTSSGSNFRVGPVNFYRAIQNRTPDGIAGAVALTLMGTRIETWPTNRLKGMAAFFSQIGYKPTSEWKEEHVFWDPLGSAAVAGNTAPGRPTIEGVADLANGLAGSGLSARTNRPPSAAVFPDGVTVQLSPDTDPREVFARWLITPQNPWFTRSIVNRVWAWLLGRGIIQEPDDIRDGNPPSNPALLAYLENQMVEGRYDLKRLYRLILNSRTYQFSSLSGAHTPEAEAAFASYPLRRLDAEVLIDAINQVAGTSDLYTSPIPEPFTYIPKGMPAVAIADGSITSPFLALFGRPARATGMEGERNNKPTPDQCLYLLNSSDLQRKLEQGPNLQAIIGFGHKPEAEILEELYLTILSRFPTAQEVKAAQGYSAPLPPKPPPGTKPGATNSVATNSVAGGSSVTNSLEPKPAAVAPAASKASETTSGATNTPAGANDPIVGSPASSPPAALGTNPVTVASAKGPRVGPVGSLGPSRKKSDKPAGTKKREDWVDIAWSLMTSDEFWYRH